jgi:hypothetical protein
MAARGGCQFAGFIFIVLDPFPHAILENGYTLKAHYFGRAMVPLSPVSNQRLSMIRFSAGKWGHGASSERRGLMSGNIGSVRTLTIWQIQTNDLAARAARPLSIIGQPIIIGR